MIMVHTHELFVTSEPNKKRYPILNIYMYICVCIYVLQPIFKVHKSTMKAAFLESHLHSPLVPPATKVGKQKQELMNCCCQGVGKKKRDMD